jgi:hypothetical protein
MDEANSDAEMEDIENVDDIIIGNTLLFIKRLPSYCLKVFVKCWGCCWIKDNGRHDTVDLRSKLTQIIFFLKFKGKTGRGLTS